jgi:hypothetical protein
MSNLEDVIARSRAPGGFSERKRFTVARAAAVRKMRQFSLVSPYYYVLELVQSAIANGATYIDLSIKKNFIGLSYVGGGYSEQELGNLFDFLFSSKADMNTADLRQLALGLNVLMLTEPELIVVESGDGTLEGTTRIDIQPRKDTVDVGKPEQALKGTFVSVRGVQRNNLARFASSRPSQYGFPELEVLSERCLCTPVPILVNDEALHGYGAMRAPVLYGYDRVLSFDEGELYGTIGIATAKHLAGFKLLTWGVWVQQIDEQPFPHVKLGGVINFNRLTKTADHSAIVRDQRYEELWARLRPWVHQLQRGKKGGAAAYDIRPLDGEALTPSELRLLLHNVSTVVSVPPVPPVSAEAARARQIGRSLDAAVLMCGDGEAALLRALGGPNLKVITPNVSTPDDALFYAQAPHAKPAGAWACAPGELRPVGVIALARALARSTGKPLILMLRALGGELEKIDAPAHMERLLPGVAAEERADYIHEERFCPTAITASVYAPLEGALCAGVRVELVVSERLVASAQLPSPYSGLIVQIELPSTARRAAMHERMPDGRALAEHLGQHLLERRIDALEQTAHRALEGLRFHACEPGSPAALLTLSAIARSALWRLDMQGDKVQVSLELVEQAHAWLLDRTVLRTLSGQARTMRQITTVHKHGLIYGVCEGVAADLEGLDTAEVLALTPLEEALLVQCVGEACYVRLDARDVLAQVEGAQLRDVALGLRAYPSGALLAEGPRAEDPLLQDALIAELIASAHQPAHAQPAAQELERRRQILRHLQWCAVQSVAAGTPRLDKMRLFADQDGHMRTLEELLRAAKRDGAVCMNGGLAQDMWLEHAAVGPPADPPRLTMNPFLFHLLCRVLPVRPSLTLPPPSGARAALWSEQVDSAEVRGALHLTLEPPDTPAIGLYSPDRQRLDLYTGHWARLGVVGELTRKDPGAHCEAALKQAAEALFERLLREVEASALEGAARERALSLLFGYAAEQLKLVRTTTGVIAQVHDERTQRILALPVFDAAHGRPVSAMRLIEDFCRAQRNAGGGQQATLTLSPALSPALRRWLQQTLAPERIQHNKAASVAALAPRPSDMTQHAARTVRERIEHTLNGWLHALNPAPWAMPEVRLVGMPGAAVAGEPYEWRERLSAQLQSTGQAMQLHGAQESQVRVLYVRTSAQELAPLFERCLQEPEALAWLLVAIYGYVNHMLEPIADTHELELHRRVARALLEGVLKEL